MRNKPILTKRMRLYIQFRVGGRDPLESAKAAGYKNPGVSAAHLEKTPTVILALNNPHDALLPEILPSQPSLGALVSWRPSPILPTSIVTREELLYGLTDIFRDKESYPAPHRILAAKMLADLYGWQDIKEKGGDVWINLGKDEQEL